MITYYNKTFQLLELILNGSSAGEFLLSHTFLPFIRLNSKSQKQMSNADRD